MDELDWTKYFISAKKTEKNKFEQLIEPPPLGPDFERNTAIVLEWIWRCGRNAIAHAHPEDLLFHVKDRWFMVNHEHYEGCVYHACDPKKMLMFYTRYQFRWERYLEHRKNPHLHMMIQDAEGACRDALWAMFNTTGKNDHFWAQDNLHKFINDTAFIGEPEKKTKANDTLEFHSCVKCQEPVPKALVLNNKLRRSKLVDVGF